MTLHVPLKNKVEGILVFKLHSSIKADALTWDTVSRAHKEKLDFAVPLAPSLIGYFTGQDQTSIVHKEIFD